MPNTEVKPYDAEDTLGEISGENMELPIFVYSSLAQSVERTAVNRDVASSSLARGAKKGRVVILFFFLPISKNRHNFFSQCEMFVKLAL